MDASTAARLINTEFHWPPGFNMRAHVYGQNRIVVEGSYEAYDTSDYWTARGRKGTFGIPPFQLDTTYVSDWQQLARWCLEVKRVINDHEDREGLRVGSQMFAPFHPHRNDGRNAYRGTRLVDNPHNQQVI